MASREWGQPRVGQGGDSSIVEALQRREVEEVPRDGDAENARDDHCRSELRVVPGHRTGQVRRPLLQVVAHDCGGFR